MALIQPKSIGREFVRRYYTILNKSPENLYCFYSDDAIFDHDDIDVMNERTVSVVGKAAIRDAMNTRRLSYRHDCTIVNTIDTATTINNGLVIQVFGEIGYNDERMRPFSQSFVLAAVSPIKYYVHNEIFRFLDLVTKPKCTTSECTQANESTMTAGEDTESADSDDSSIPNEPISSTLLKSDENIHTTEQSNGQQPQINGDQNTLVSDVNTSSAVEQSVPTILSAQTCEISPIKNQLFQDKCILTIGNVVNPNIDADDQNRSYELLQKKQQGIQTDENNNTSLEEFTQAILKANSENTVTKTYADSLKSNRLTSQNTLPSSPVLPTPSVSSDGSPKETKKPADSTKQRPIGARRGSQKSGKKSLSKESFDQRNDLLQVFIGNIPHSATERELMAIFRKFGKISRFRVHTNAKKAWLPRYAFVTYDSMTSVLQCLANRQSIYYPENSSDSQKLNVNGDKSIVVEPNECKSTAVINKNDIEQCENGCVNTTKQKTTNDDESAGSNSVKIRKLDSHRSQSTRYRGSSNKM